MGTAGVGKLITETRASQAREPFQAREWAGGSIAPPRGREGSRSCEWDIDGPILMVLRRLGAQVCMSVIQQICVIACKIE
jgi:hypothetical protein